jgi:NAD(P)-dependent dehydrogenase (short-subunit alcohol dehydrogenase family)
MSKVWLITGSGTGLGREIAEAALATGAAVVATARDPVQLADLAERFGSKVHVVGLDVTNDQQGIAAVAAAVDVFGRLDVLVNNAGFGDLRPFEQTPPDDVRKVIETCLYGVINLTRAALPVMRRQRNGHIIQISSAGGRTAFPVGASYYAAKWGVGGFTEGVALEVAPFGVKATVLEPGAMRTNWGRRATNEEVDIWPDYEPSVGAALKAMEGLWGNESGDPARVAQVVLKIAEAESLPPHILLGTDVLQGIRVADRARSDAADRWEAITNSIDYGVEGPIPALPPY